MYDKISLKTENSSAIQKVSSASEKQMVKKNDDYKR